MQASKEKTVCFDLLLSIVYTLNNWWMKSSIYFKKILAKETAAIDKWDRAVQEIRLIVY